jgi:HEAT repeat protein
LSYYGVGLDSDGLRLGLHDFSPDIRSMAAVKLGQERTKEAIPWLADALTHESALGTQVHIANALAALDDGRGIAKLQDLCTVAANASPLRDAWVNFVAASDVLRFHVTSCNDAVIRALRLLDGDNIAGDPLVPNLMAVGMSVATALESLSEGQVGAIREIADSWLINKDMGVRQSAAIALGAYGNKASNQKLRAALAVELNPMVRTVMQREVLRSENRMTAKP